MEESARQRIFFEAFKARGTLDALSWATLGTESASMLDEELAFECFQMAHLQDPEKWKTNSDIPIPTYLQK